jgi:hypothetical protein
VKREVNDKKETPKKMLPKNELMSLYKATLWHIRFEATTSNLQTWIFEKET